MPIEACAQIIRAKSQAVFHVDCVQALTKIDFNYDLVDCASFSAHKINGVKGSGLLYKKERVLFHPLITGGQQEKGIRPGTPNAVHHILMAKTIRLAFEQAKDKHVHVLAIKHYLMDAFESIESIVLNSPLEACSDYILNISCLKVPSQIMLNWLSSHQIYVSAMATCLNRDVRPSHVLEAMGISGDRLNGVIRISIGYVNTLEDAKRLIEVMEEGIKKYGRI